MLYYLLVAGLVPVVLTGCGEFVDHLRSRRLQAELRTTFGHDTSLGAPEDLTPLCEEGVVAA